MLIYNYKQRQKLKISIIMAQQSKNQKVEAAQSVVEAVSKTEQFFKDHGKKVTYVGIGAVVVALVVLSYIHFYVKPMQKEAADQTFVAEQLFRESNYEQALNGDGNALGFAQIISEYGSNAGDAVYFYAGVCELKLGNPDSAISYLKRYNGDDEIISARAICCMGDAYAMKEDYKSALSLYEKAANASDNAYAAGYLLKAGIIAEELGDNAKALQFYEKVKNDYPQTLEGYEIEKYITRIKVK